MATQTRTPGTIQNISGGSVAWSNINNVTVQDGNYATATASSVSVTTDLLRCTNFGFSIPDGSTVNSVTAKIRKSGNGGGDITDQDVYEFYTVRTGPNLSEAPDLWSTSDTNHFYTLSETLPSVLNNSQFGIEISATVSYEGSDNIARIDLIEITIDYIPPNPGTGAGTNRSLLVSL